MELNSQKLSIVLPAKNEANGLRETLPKLKSLFPESEIIIVNDGSTDSTIDVCDKNHVTCVSHAYSMGNGAAIKTGTRIATGDILIFMDADGQHDPNDIPRLLEPLNTKFPEVEASPATRSGLPSRKAT